MQPNHYLDPAEREVASLAELAQTFPQCIAVQTAYRSANLYLTLLRDDSPPRIRKRPDYLKALLKCKEGAEKEAYFLENYRKAEIFVGHMYPTVEC